MGLFVLDKFELKEDTYGNRNQYTNTGIVFGLI